MAKEKDLNNYIRITTPLFRLSFPHLETPQPPMGKGEPKFAIKMMFPKATADADLKEIRALCARSSNSFFKGNVPAKIKKPLRDGDDPAETKFEEDKGFLFAAARSKDRPPCFDGNLNEIPVSQLKERFYPGCWCYAGIQIGAGDTGGSPYVHFALASLQFARHDTKFSNRPDAKQDFQAVAGYVDEAANAPEGAAADFSAVTF